MELRRLALLHELARLGTIAAVAQTLSYSPSSVSVQLAELEREAGTQLLRRVGRNVELTAAGHRLAVHAATALAADESVLAELADLHDVVAGSLRVSVVQSTAFALLPGMLHRLAATAPELEVRVVHSETMPALEELRSRAIDLVIGIEYDPLPVPRHRDLDRQDLLREDVVLMLHPQHPAVTKRGPVRLAACENSVWATGHHGTGIDAVLRNVCNRLAGYEPEIRHRSDDGLILGALVASGRAVALLPAMIATSISQVVARPIREERLKRTIFTAARGTASRSPAIHAARLALHTAARDITLSRRDVHTPTTS
jgi:DNA-binding transcriptional LysR family regulator